VHSATLLCLKESSASALVCKVYTGGVMVHTVGNPMPTFVLNKD